jgi:predicted PurR-regulated permease PerM
VSIGLIQGGVGGLAFWFLGLPSPVLWTFVMMILSMIPMMGAPFVWVPAAISLAATGHWTKAIILVAWGVLIINPIDNFLRPKLVTERAKLHELFVFFSVIGGIKVFGILGIVLGPLLLAITISLLEIFRQADSDTPGTSAGEVNPLALPIPEPHD